MTAAIAVANAAARRERGSDPTLDELLAERGFNVVPNPHSCVERCWSLTLDRRRIEVQYNDMRFSNNYHVYVQRVEVGQEDTAEPALCIGGFSHDRWLSELLPFIDIVRKAI